MGADRLKFMPAKQRRAKPILDRYEAAAWKARHNVPLATLAQDEDERFRPSARLMKLAKASWVPAFRSLDRPLVPVLNELVAKGLETKFSCADSQLLVCGVSEEAVRLLQPLRAHLPGAYFEWLVMNESLVTQLRWRARDRTANDAALLVAAAEIADLPSVVGQRSGDKQKVGLGAVEEMHPAAEIVAHAYAHVQRLMDYRQSPTIVLSQTATGYLLHVGYSLTGTKPTKIAAEQLTEIAEQFEIIFPRREEALELS